LVDDPLHSRHAVGDGNNLLHREATELMCIRCHRSQRIL
jgi:hypothetical protein